MLKQQCNLTAKHRTIWNLSNSKYFIISCLDYSLEVYYKFNGCINTNIKKYVTKRYPCTFHDPVYKETLLNISCSNLLEHTLVSFVSQLTRNQLEIEIEETHWAGLGLTTDKRILCSVGLKRSLPNLFSKLRLHN